jgi:hypothetical protein
LKSLLWGQRFSCCASDVPNPRVNLLLQLKLVIVSSLTRTRARTHARARAQLWLACSPNKTAFYEISVIAQAHLKP